MYASTWLNDDVLDCYIETSSFKFYLLCPSVFIYSLQLCDIKNKLTCSLACDFHYWQLYMGLTLVLCMVLCLFQKELERARMEQACVTSEKQNLERQLQKQESDHTELNTSYSDLEVARLKAEIEACISDSGACIWLEFQIQNYIFDRYRSVQLFIFTKCLLGPSHIVLVVYVHSPAVQALHFISNCPNMNMVTRPVVEGDLKSPVPSQ